MELSSKPIPMIQKLAFLLALLSQWNAYAQTKQINTLTYDSTIGSPAATLQDIEWIKGYWRGEALGGITEEIWSPPLGNSMMCAFKLVIDSKVKFYELVIISQEDETLILRLKHFHWDLKGWEEKDETRDFKLVKVTPDKVYFDGFTFENAGEELLNVYVILRSKEGSTEEVKFSYRKSTI